MSLKDEIKQKFAFFEKLEKVTKWKHVAIYAIRSILIGYLCTIGGASIISSIFKVIAGGL
jgi:hypothetical protein